MWDSENSNLHLNFPIQVGELPESVEHFFFHPDSKSTSLLLLSQCKLLRRFGGVLEGTVTQQSVNQQELSA